MFANRSMYAVVVSAFAVALVVVASGPAAAQQTLEFGTPDGEPPAIEGVCDGQSGAAFGLCNAYCEAMDCHSVDAEASSQACDKVREKFENLTGEELPCELDCPCVNADAAWRELIENADSITECLAVSASEQFFGIAVRSSDVEEIPFAGDGTPTETVCGAFGGVTKILPLSVGQAQSCVAFLVDLAESELGQGECPGDPR